jgi:hypothetical protein
MKYRIIVMAVFMVSLVWTACTGKKEDSPATTVSDSKEWKEMDEFHMIMAETFHPYKDSADLKPVKDKALELVAVADKWSNAPLPEKVNSDEMKTRLQTLKGETEVLADVVQNGQDSAIGDQLNKVHDLFHEIQEAWYADGDGHDHEH